MDWKNSVCGDCEFRVDNECRRFPPSFRQLNNKFWPGYVIRRDKNKACAEFKQEQPNDR